MVRTGEDHGSWTRRQLRELFVALAGLLLVVWGAYGFLGDDFWRDAVGFISGYAAAFTLVAGLTLSQRWGKRVAFALLMLWMSLVFLSLTLPTGLGFIGGEGFASQTSEGLLWGIPAATLMWLFPQYIPSREEQRRNRRNALRNLGLALRNLGLIAAVLAGLVLLVVGAYVLIEYVLGPVVRSFA